MEWGKTQKVPQNRRECPGMIQPESGGPEWRAVLQVRKQKINHKKGMIRVLALAFPF